MPAHNQTQVKIPIFVGFPPVLFSPPLVETLAIEIHYVRRTGNLMFRSGVICSELCQAVLMQTLKVTFQSEQQFRRTSSLGIIRMVIDFDFIG